MRGIILGRDDEKLVIEASPSDIAIFSKGHEVAVNNLGEKHRSDDFYLGRLYEREVADGYRGSRDSREEEELKRAQLEGTLRHFYGEYGGYGRLALSEPRQAYCRLIADSGCSDVRVMKWPPPGEIVIAGSFNLPPYWDGDSRQPKALQTQLSRYVFVMVRQTGPITFEYRER